VTDGISLNESVIDFEFISDWNLILWNHRLESPGLLFLGILPSAVAHHFTVGVFVI